MVRLAGALLLMMLPLVASAEPNKLFDPPRTDDSPTAFACTAQTLAAGSECVFEGKPAKSSSAADNSARLRGMATTTCDAALKGALAADAQVLREGCMARFQAAASRCAAEGALLDPDGRFTSSGQGCYRALSEARNQAEGLANAAPSCCACLSRNHCTGAAASCVASAARGTLAANCQSDACDASCAELLSLAPGPIAKSKTPARARSAK